MKKQLIVEQIDGSTIEIIIPGAFTNDKFIIEVSDLGFTITGTSISKTFLTEEGTICLSPIGDGKIELYIG